MRKLIFLLLLGMYQISYAETAIERANLYFKDLESYQFSRAAAHFDPEQLKEFTSMMGFYKEIPDEAQSQFLAVFFGQGATIAQVEELNDVDFFASIFRFIMNQAEAAGGLNFDGMEILGEVPEGNDVAHLVTRNRVSVGQIKMESMEVVSLRKNGNEWRVMLSGKIKGIPAQLKSAFSGKS